jgi:hypothetical protein
MVTQTPQQRDRLGPGRHIHTIKGAAKAFFGYALHATVRVPEDTKPQDTPCIAERIMVSDVNAGYAAPHSYAIDMLESITTKGQHLSDVLVDRAYNYKDPESFAYPAKRLGAELVFDLHKLDRGLKGSFEGALLVDGWFYSPTLPEKLRNLTPPPIGANRRQIAEFQDKIAQREQYAFKTLGAADRDGYQRIACPAYAGKLDCPHQTPPASSGQPLPVYPPAQCSQYKVCIQATITVPPDTDGKRRQKHIWGSRRWYHSWQRRNRVEGWFGNIKNEATDGLTRGRFRVAGLAKVTLMIAMWATATNLRLVQRWQERHTCTGNPPAVKKPRSRYRKRTLNILSAPHTPAQDP